GQEAEPSGRGVGSRGLRGFGWARGFDERHDGPGADGRRVQALFGQLETLGPARVAGDLADPQVVVEEDLLAPLALHFMMKCLRAPAHERLLVAPAREREQPPLARQAAVAHVVDEAVDTLELGAQPAGVAQIGVPLPGAHADLEDDAEHGATPFRLAM